MSPPENIIHQDRRAPTVDSLVPPEIAAKAEDIGVKKAALDARSKMALSLIAGADIAFGAIFELPVVVFFLSRMGLVHYSTLAKGRGIALVVIFVVAALLTPPDVFTQFLMAGPLYILYEISIWVSRLFGTADQSQEEAAEDATA